MLNINSLQRAEVAGWMIAEVFAMTEYFRSLLMALKRRAQLVFAVVPCIVDQLMIVHPAALDTGIIWASLIYLRLYLLIQSVTKGLDWLYVFVFYGQFWIKKIKNKCFLIPAFFSRWSHHCVFYKIKLYLCCYSSYLTKTQKSKNILSCNLFFKMAVIFIFLRGITQNP